MAQFEPAFTPEERERVIHGKGSSHPLEMFLVFRRWAPGFWRDLAYTFLWNVGFTALFLFIGMLVNLRLPSTGALWATFVIANCVGYTLHFLFHADRKGDRAVPARTRPGGRRRLLHGDQAPAA